MGVGLDIPETVGQCTTGRASDLLLTPAPFGKLDLVREENAARHDMDKTEFGVDSPQSLLRLFTLGC